ncbi:MAG: peptidase D-alanyl-D-alanine carboxypeptidase 1 [Myxococcales bacterium]|nr:peptidase D-alanyl-D-alanine carboxypeptidase 1 [Myxococcales bacterium]
MRPLVCWVVLSVIGGPTWAGDLPELKSRSVVVIDAESGAEIFGKDADEIRPIASTTKIFVALAVRKKGLDLDGWTEITKVDAKQARGGAKTRLDIGERFRNIDLLRAMLMASDNRAPSALGRAAGMSPGDLVQAMNEVAKTLHLKRTKFTDTTGLRGNISTAREMTIALRAAIDDSVLREIMRDEFEVVVGKGGRPKIPYGTTNQPLLAKKYDVIGGKTGYTTAAGYCYVTAARFAEKTIVMAFLGAEGKQTRFADFNRVASWLERGAPGAKVSTKAHARRTPPRLDTDVRGHVSN